MILCLIGVVLKDIKKVIGGKYIGMRYLIVNGRVQHPWLLGYIILMNYM